MKNVLEIRRQKNGLVAYGGGSAMDMIEAGMLCLREAHKIISKSSPKKPDFKEFMDLLVNDIGD